MSMELQAKLLRVLQERKIRRVGGEAEIPINVRWIAATNREPEQAIRDGLLRQDLFFRLNVVPLRLPPLRERREDISSLAQHFLRRYAQEYERPKLRFSGEVLRVLSEHDWPGNVRELQNLVERIVSVSGPGEEITLADLPEELILQTQREASRSPVPGDRAFHEAKAEAIADFEKQYLRHLLSRHRGNISEAARQAGIDRKTIHRMLTKYQLEA